MARPVRRRLLAALALVASACLHPVRFAPASPADAVPDQPEAAAVEGWGVRLVVHAGDWRGIPTELQDRIVPVDVYLENASGKTLRIGPERFGLTAGGFQYRPMPPGEVQRLVAAQTGSSVYFGFHGGIPGPAFGFSPYVGWGWFGAPGAVYASPSSGQAAPPVPRGALQNGGSVSLLLFFPVAAQALTAFDVTAELVEDSGSALGQLAAPLVRQGASPPPPGGSSGPSDAKGPPPPVPSAPPSAPPSGPPPPPPSSPPPPPPSR